MRLLNSIHNKISSLFSDKDDRFDAIYNDYYKRIFVYIINFNINKDDANEIAQNVFLKIYENIDNFDNSKNVSSFIFTIARNKVFDFFRTQKRVISTVGFDDNDIIDNNLDYCFLENTNYDELNRMIKELNEHERELLFLKYREELSYKEIADMLHITEKKVRSRLYEVRKKLRERWEVLNG